MSVQRRVLLLGLDAADGTVVERLIEHGALPALQRLRNGGRFGRLESSGNLYAGGVWPSFYTGQPVAAHGIFHNKQWRPERMRVEVPGEDWLGARPFWEALAGEDLDVCVIDVPMVLGRPSAIKGTCLAGWGTHDLIARGSWPEPLWRELEHRFGRPVMPVEHFGRQSASSLRRLGDQLVQTTEQLSDVARHLLSSRPWRFGCVIFGAIHRAGHYLWDRSQTGDALPPRSRSDVIEPALARVYAAVDAAIGDILAQVPDDTLVIAFAVHGMGPNPGWADLFPDMLAKLQAAAGGRAPKRGSLYALKQKLPFHWVRPVITRLPASLKDRLVSVWSRRMFDWSSTQYFPLPMDEAGYIRVNLRGREPRGIVEPGSEYDALCSEIGELLASLRDEASGASIAGGIVRAYATADPAAPYRRLLPDLVVPWRAAAVRNVRRVVSNAVTGFAYQVPARLPSGRTGNHNGNAWFLAHGPFVEPGVAATGNSILDLAPTVIEQLGLVPDPSLPGRPIRLRARQ